MVPTCSGPDNTLSRTIAFRYIYGPGLILSTLARAKIRYPKLTPVNHAARRETSRLPQPWSRQTWNVGQHVQDYWAGSPRVMAHPGLPQIQTCRLPASGSSSHDFAAQLKGLWTTRALGRPYRSSSRSKSDHERGLPRRRRDSHRFQICRAPRRKFWRLAMLPMIP